MSLYKVRHPINERINKFKTTAMTISSLLLVVLNIILLVAIYDFDPRFMPLVFLFTPLIYVIDKFIWARCEDRIKEDLFINNDYSGQAAFLLENYKKQLSQMCDIYKFQEELYEMAIHYPEGNPEYAATLDKILQRVGEREPILARTLVTC